MITPDEILNRQFSHVRRDGYDRRQVDSFLDEVCRDYRELLQEADRAKAEVRALQVQAEEQAQAPREADIEERLEWAQNEVDALVAERDRLAEENRLLRAEKMEHEAQMEEDFPEEEDAEQMPEAEEEQTCGPAPWDIEQVIQTQEHVMAYLKVAHSRAQAVAAQGNDAASRAVSQAAANVRTLMRKAQAFMEMVLGFKGEYEKFIREQQVFVDGAFSGVQQVWDSGELIQTVLDELQEKAGGEGILSIEEPQMPEFGSVLAEERPAPKKMRGRKKAAVHAAEEPPTAVQIEEKEEAPRELAAAEER